MDLKLAEQITIVVEIGDAYGQYDDRKNGRIHQVGIWCLVKRKQGVSAQFNGMHQRVPHQDGSY